MTTERERDEQEKLERARALKRRLQAVLPEFGLTLEQFDPGFIATRADNRDVYVQADRNTWEWLEPLLLELLTFRRLEASQLHAQE